MLRKNASNKNEKGAGHQDWCKHLLVKSSKKPKQIENSSNQQQKKGKTKTKGDQTRRQKRNQSINTSKLNKSHKREPRSEKFKYRRTLLIKRNQQRIANKSRDNQ